MQWLNPAGAWALLSLAIITALYLLKRQSVRMQAPSLLLWRSAMQEQTASRPFQKLKKNILYFLQILLALLLSASLMRPAVGGGMQGETVFIFDLSASMQTRENGETRLESAQQKALALLDGMHAGDCVTVLSAGAQVRQTITRCSDAAQVRAAVQRLEAENGTADLTGAVSLAKAMARDIPGLNVIVFSDTFAGDEGVQVVRVGTPQDNCALLGLSCTQEGQAFARVANYGAAAEITLECYADGRLCDMAVLTLAEGENASAILQTPEEFMVLRVVIAGEDALVLDNERYYVRTEESGYSAVLCNENVFLEKALKLRTDITVLRTTAEESTAIENIDLYIYDGALPETLPDIGAVLAVNPQAQVRGISCEEEKEPSGVLRASADASMQSLTQHLLLETIALRSFTPLTGGQSVLLQGGDTLLAVQQDAQGRTAVLGFDLHDSNLPLKADFPVLMQNLLSYLLPQLRQEIGQVSCGDVLTLMEDARAQTSYVLSPAGQKMPLDALTTNEQGVYTLVRQYADGGERRAQFAVHGAESEYDVRVVGAQGSASIAQQTRSAAGRELTSWVLLAFLTLLLVEWGVSRRVA